MWRTTVRSLAAHKRRLVATGSAVVLAVTFLSAALLLVHTVRRGYADELAAAYAGTDAVVRSSVEVGLEEVTERGLVDRSLAATLADVDGVAAVAPRREGSGRVVGADGDPLGGSGPTIAADWVDDDRLNPYALAAGRAPVAPGEVVVDKAAAEEGDLAIGDTTVVRMPDPVDVRIVGLATFGGADSQGAATFAGFAPDFADQIVLPGADAGKASSIAVAAAPGVGQAELVRRLDAMLPDGVEVLTGAEVVREAEELVQGEDAESFQQALLLFAFVALVVSTFTIDNTFSIVVAQRSREAALLRALGATRGQLLRSVVGEAAAVGALASGGGVVAGLGVATGLLAVMDGLGLAVPGSSPEPDPATVVIALAVGVAATLVASLMPAVRASRVAPMAALRDVDVDRSGTSRWRAVTGVVMTAAGVGLTITGAAVAAVETTGLGVLATIVGVVVLGPAAARPAAAALGATLALTSHDRCRPVRRRRPADPAVVGDSFGVGAPVGVGDPGRSGRLVRPGRSGRPARLGRFGGGGQEVSWELARRNAMRNPRRTAGTATSLMLGVAVVSLFTVVAASLQRSLEDLAAEQIRSDLWIVGEGRGGLSTDLAPAIRREVPEVAVVSPLGGAAVRIDGRGVLVTTVDPATIDAVADLEVERGSLRDLGIDGIAVSSDYAADHGLTLGAPVAVEYPDGVTERPRVGAIYGNATIVGGGGLVLPRAASLAHTSRPADTNLLIGLADGVPVGEGETAVQRVADRFDAPDVMTNDELTDTIGGEIELILTVVYALLALAIVIALLGIANALSLSIHERTRELGLLRAVGQTRRQSRAMVRGEALIVALYGTVGGLGLGLFLAWAMVSALSGDSELGITSFSVPVVPLVVILALGALAGIAAAVRPARRAAHLDLLAAIATE